MGSVFSLPQRTLAAVLAITPDRKYDFGGPMLSRGLAMFKGIADASAGFVNRSSVP